MNGTRNRVGIFLTSVLILGMMACSTMQVDSEKDPGANLAKYKTYAWAPETQPGPNKLATSMLDQTVTSITDQQLVNKGLHKVPASDADLILTYSAMAHDDVTYGMTPYDYWGWGWGPGTFDHPYVTREGSLTLHFIDPKIRRTVWQGTATEAIGYSGPNQKDIAEAVKGIVEKYPPA